MVGARLDKLHGGPTGRQAVAAGHLGQHLGQLAGQLFADRRPHPLGVAGRVQRQRALGQAGDGEVVGPGAERQHQPPPADRPRPGEEPLAGQVQTIDLGLDEADPPGQHVLQRDAHRAGGAGAAGDRGSSVSAWW